MEKAPMMRYDNSQKEKRKVVIHMAKKKTTLMASALAAGAGAAVLLAKKAKEEEQKKGSNRIRNGKGADNGYRKRTARESTIPAGTTRRSPGRKSRREWKRKTPILWGAAWRPWQQPVSW